MNAVRFMKMDFLKIKSQVKLIILVFAIVVVFGFKNPVWSAMYMIFMGIILSSIPFSIDASDSGGFTTLLPARARSRVYGRFLYGFVLLLACTLVGCVLIIPFVLKENMDIKLIVSQIVGFFGAGMIINSVQFFISYFFEIKNAQMLSLMRIIPGFVFFFGGSVLMEKISENQENANFFSQIVSKVIENQEVVLVGFWVISMLISWFCMWLCAKREERKEG